MSKIMVVDDDPNIRELVCALMKNGGFDTCEAKDGRSALQRMMDENPDLAIVDLMMPNIDGYELCRKIRQYYDNMPVLMLTAKAELPSKVKGFESGADDYLTKPFEGAVAGKMPQGRIGRSSRNKPPVYIPFKLRLSPV